MGWPRGTYGQQELYTGFWLGHLMERDHSEDVGVMGG
jgi:hypothetical protein